MQVITESDRILGILEERYTEASGFPAMLPPSGTGLADHATRLKRLERRMFAWWLNWLCCDRDNQVSCAAPDRTGDGDRLDRDWARDRVVNAHAGVTRQRDFGTS